MRTKTEQRPYFTFIKLKTTNLLVQSHFIYKAYYTFEYKKHKYFVYYVYKYVIMF